MAGERFSASPMAEAIVRLEALWVVGEALEEPPGGRDRAVGGPSDALEEQVQPSLPVALDADLLQQLVVMSPGAASGRG